MSAKILVSLSCLIVAICGAPEAFFHPGVAPLYSFATHYGAARALQSPYAGFRAVPAVPEQHYVESNIPAAYPEVKAAPVPAPVPAPVRAAVPAPAPAPVRAAVPAPAPAPVQGAAPVHATQYHAQDEFGNVDYGYANPNSAKQESRDAYGRVQGSYSYVDATGQTNIVRYVADDAGFRVVGANNLPIGPVDTPEVAAAKAEHFRQLRLVGHIF